MVICRKGAIGWKVDFYFPVYYLYIDIFKLNSVRCKFFPGSSLVFVTLYLRVYGPFKMPAFVLLAVSGAQSEALSVRRVKLCRSSHWEFCFISFHTALKQTCKSAVMSAACVSVVVGGVVERGKGDELTNLNSRKGRWRNRRDADGLAR